LPSFIGDFENRRGWIWRGGTARTEPFNRNHNARGVNEKTYYRITNYIVILMKHKNQKKSADASGAVIRTGESTF